MNATAIKISDLDQDLQDKISDYPLKRQFDYIVLGAGISGIIMAMQLVKLEFKVLLIDKHRVPGGVAQSYDRKVNGVKYECEAFTDFVPLSQEGWLLSSLKIFLPETNIAFYAPKNFLTLVLANNKMIDIANGHKALIGSIHQYNPLAHKGILEIIKIFKHCHNDLMKVNQIGKKYKNAYDFLSHHMDNNEDALNLIEAFSNFFLRVPTHLLSAQQYIFHMSEYFKDGVYYPVKGFQNLINALVNEFELGGGFFLHKTLINELALKNDNKAVASLTSNYNHKFKAKEFVSAIPNPYLIDHLLTDKKSVEADKNTSESNKKLLEKFRQQNQDSETSHLSYGRVTLLLKDEVAGSLKNRGYIYINEHNLHREALIKAVTAKEYDKLPLMVCNYKALNRQTDSPGQSISITFHDSLANWDMNELNDDFKQYRKNIDYLKTKQKVANIIVKRVLKVFPQIKPLIVKIELATPFTIRRYLNTPNANPYGSLANPHELWKLQSFYTPYKNLFIANATTFPGGSFQGRWKAALNCQQVILSSISKIKNKKASEDIWSYQKSDAMEDHHIAEIVDGENYLMHAVKKYVPIKRYVNLTLGLSFSKSEHYLLKYTTKEIEIAPCTLEKANEARVYCWMPLPLFKDYLNKRTKPLKHTFQGTMRVKGGLGKFKKMIEVLLGETSIKKPKSVFDENEPTSKPRKRPKK